jgi:phosphohistidine phosphatase
MAIDLYLIRHGLAEKYGRYQNDELRPLTEEGVRKTRQVADRLHALGLHFDRLLTSPLVRARQTAEILQQAGVGKTLEESRILAPEGTLRDWEPWFENWKRLGETGLALVGHEPNLSSWAEQMVWGPSCQHLEMKKAGIIGLHVPDSGSVVGASEMFWLTPPRFLLK